MWLQNTCQEVCFEIQEYHHMARYALNPWLLSAALTEIFLSFDVTWDESNPFPIYSPWTTNSTLILKTRSPSFFSNCRGVTAADLTGENLWLLQKSWEVNRAVVHTASWTVTDNNLLIRMSLKTQHICKSLLVHYYKTKDSRITIL